MCSSSGLKAVFDGHGFPHTKDTVRAEAIVQSYYVLFYNRLGRLHYLCVLHKRWNRRGRRSTEGERDETRANPSGVFIKHVRLTQGLFSVSSWRV